MNAAHKRKLMALMVSKLDAIRDRETKPRGPASAPNKMHLLDLPDEAFIRLITGTSGEPPGSLLLAILRWSSPGWPGPSVRMTRSYNYNASYALGRQAGSRRTRIPRAV